MYLGTVAHELIHALGFWHEQSRADRDDFVTFKWDNIYPENHKDFEKKSLASTDPLDEKYDYYSIM